MIIGTAFTLFVVPSIYMLVARTRVTAPASELAEGGVLPQLEGLTAGG